MKLYQTDSAQGFKDGLHSEHVEHKEVELSDQELNALKNRSKKAVSMDQHPQSVRTEARDSYVAKLTGQQPEQANDGFVFNDEGLGLTKDNEKAQAAREMARDAWVEKLGG